MNLLILTQKVDVNDDVLGFFHGWIIKFAETFSEVVVVCLQKGACHLPDNVRVLSLGKEDGVSRMKYVGKFYRYIFAERNNYDAVFVHMNPVYILLGGLFWKLWQKKYMLWFNHPLGSPLARMAIAMTETVFCTSPHAYAKRFQKTRLMPAGIDADIFKKNNTITKRDYSFLYLGRISPIKRIEHLIDAAKALDEKKTDFVLNIIGSPMTGEDIEYEERLKASARELVTKGKVKFFPKVVNSKTPQIYNQNEIFVNLTPTGSFDKTILEAMACETLVIVSNRSFDGILSEEFIFKEDSSKDLAEKLSYVLALSEERKFFFGENLRKHTVESHSLDRLINKIKKYSGR